MVAQPSTGVLLQMVTQNHTQAEDGHKRLREDFRELERSLDAVATAQRALQQRVEKIEQTPVSVEKVSFSGKLVVAIVGTCLVLAGGMWRLQVGIDNLHTEIGATSTAVSNAAKLQDERTATQREQIQDINAKLELRRIEIQNLSNKVSEYMLQKAK